MFIFSVIIWKVVQYCLYWFFPYTFTLFLRGFAYQHNIDRNQKFVFFFYYYFNNFPIYFIIKIKFKVDCVNRYLMLYKIYQNLQNRLKEHFDIVGKHFNIVINDFFLDLIWTFRKYKGVYFLKFIKKILIFKEFYLFFPIYIKSYNNIQ